MLTESEDKRIRENSPELAVRKKWKLEQCKDLAETIAKHREVVGMVQDSRVRLGGRKSGARFWSEVGARERRKLKLDEVRVLQEEQRLAEAAHQDQQEGWLNCNGVESRSYVI